MKPSLILRSYAFQHALSIAIAVLMAVFFGRLSSSRSSWLVFTAFMVCQTTRGTPLRQNFKIFLAIIFTYLLSTILNVTINNDVIRDIFIGLFFIVLSYYSYRERTPTTDTQLYMAFVFIILFVVLNITQADESLMRTQLIDIVIGAVIGIGCGQLIFPSKLGNEFCQGLVPILQNIIDYSQTFALCIQDKKPYSKLLQKKLQIENALASEASLYPDWAFEEGLNPGLKSGFRFFLLHLEWVIERLLSMDYIFMRDRNLLVAHSDESAGFVNALLSVIAHNNALINVLIEYFRTRTIQNVDTDFIGDVVELEKKLKLLAPNDMELLETFPESLPLIALYRDVKDCRELLMQLIISLQIKP